MKKSYILPLVGLALLATGCSNEDGFEAGSTEQGKVLKSAFAVEVKADALTRAADNVEADLDNFNLVFTLEGHTEPSAKYRYGDMPDVVTLPAGKYTCTATYGENRLAEWENPYFLGVSEQFEVVAYEICSYIEPIVCKLENIKVSVDFDKSLRDAMSDDSYVEVKVGSSSALNFGLAEADAQKAGYFKHSDEITLVAVFNGVVDGVETVETKSYKNIEKGCHYKINFKLHTGSDGNATGDANANLNVDASVSVVDVERNVEIGDDPLLDDSERPIEGEPVDPEDPDEPVEQTPPTISAQAPVNIDAVNDGNSMTTCVLDIHSSAEGGIIAFTCDIESDLLTPEELEGVGLASHLDLVNTPENLQKPLSGLGFPVNVGGYKDVQFNLTNFLPMLQGLGECEHHFVLSVTDANGTTVKTLKIKY